MLAITKSGVFMDGSVVGSTRPTAHLNQEVAMPKEARVAVLGLAAASLLSLMVDYMIKEMGRRPTLS